MSELQVLPTAARITVKSTTVGLSSVGAPAIQFLLQKSLPANPPPHVASVPMGASGVGIGTGVMQQGGPASLPAATKPSTTTDLLDGLF